jgi:DNA-binding transcriptional MerR regulator
MGHVYRVREFAALAGVTVRSLHHYDRLGLLKPRRTAAGYRLYAVEDLKTLEQIVALKFIGLPLGEIRTLLRRSPGAVAAALHAQRVILREKKRLLEQTIEAIQAAEAVLNAGDAADSQVYRRIIEVIAMQNQNDEWKRQYDELVQEKLERLREMTADDKARLRQQFADLFQQAEAVADEDPAGPRAQALAGRYADLLRTFTRKAELNPQLQKVVAAFLTVGDSPSGEPPAEPGFGGKRTWAFMAKALAVRAGAP